MVERVISIFILVCFLITGQMGPCPVYAQDFRLPAPGSMISITPSYIPLTLKGLIIHPENALKFDFLMDTGNSNLKGDGLSDEALKMMKYFLTALTIPEDDLWVNLSPYEKERIIQNNFGQTIMGRDLLAQDYVLKQLTASLIYPEKTLGKEFWQQVYSNATKEFGTTQIPVNTFNKVWIVPSEAVVWEHNNKVLIVKSHLKVMLEEDYLSLQKHVSLRGAGGDEAISERTSNKDTHALASKIVRAIVLPVLEKEVNEGKNFAQLRQMYQAMILATWYKKALRESILNKVYVDQRKTKGVDGINAGDVESIYQQYLKAFKKGAFNYIKEDIDPATGQTVPRKYFSGGFSLKNGLTSLATALLIWGTSVTFSQQRAIAQASQPTNGGQIVLVQGTMVETASGSSGMMRRDVKKVFGSPTFPALWPILVPIVVIGISEYLSHKKMDVRVTKLKLAKSVNAIAAILENAENNKDYITYNLASDALDEMGDTRGRYVYKLTSPAYWEKVIRDSAMLHEPEPGQYRKAALNLARSLIDEQRDVPIEEINKKMAENNISRPFLIQVLLDFLLSSSERDQVRAATLIYTIYLNTEDRPIYLTNAFKMASKVVEFLNQSGRSNAVDMAMIGGDSNLFSIEDIAAVLKFNQLFKLIRRKKKDYTEEEMRDLLTKLKAIIIKTEQYSWSSDAAYVDSLKGFKMCAAFFNITKSKYVTNELFDVFRDELIDLIIGEENYTIDHQGTIQAITQKESFRMLRNKFEKVRQAETEDVERLDKEESDRLGKEQEKIRLERAQRRMAKKTASVVLPGVPAIQQSPAYSVSRQEPTQQRGEIKRPVRAIRDSLDILLQKWDSKNSELRIMARKNHGFNTFIVRLSKRTLLYSDEVEERVIQFADALGMTKEEFFNNLSSTEDINGNESPALQNPDRSPSPKKSPLAISIYQGSKYVSEYWERSKDKIIAELNLRFLDENIAITDSKYMYKKEGIGIYRFRIGLGGKAQYSLYVKYYKDEKILVIIGFGPTGTFHAKDGFWIKENFHTYLMNINNSSYEDLKREKRLERLQDAAMVESPSLNNGGIDLNTKLLDLQIKRDGNGVPLPISQQPLDKINIQGFVPEIISIQPVDLQVLLGLKA